MYNTILQEYNTGKTVAELSNEYKVSKNRIYTFLRDNGIILYKRRGFKTNPNIDVNFFKTIDTEEKAYILGLMYSDGSLSPYWSKDRNHICSYKLRIRLQEQDGEILRKISYILCKEDLVKIIIRRTKNWSNIASFQLGNITLGKDLVKLGCTPNKSSTISLPSFDKVPEELFRHFIRGFYDGDGGIKKTLPIVMSFTSNKAMCNQIKEFMETKYGIIFAPYKERENGYGSVVLSGRDNCYKLYKLLYEECSIFLNRKKSLIERVITSYSFNRSSVGRTDDEGNVWFICNKQKHVSKNMESALTRFVQIKRERLFERYPPV